MAVGRCPQRTVFVEIGTLRPFSDAAGRHAVRLTNDVERRRDLAMRLKHAGCRIDLSGDAWQSAGDFSQPRVRTARGSAAKESPLTHKALASRPFITSDDYSADWGEDEHGEEYLVEMPHATNIGEEAAVSIQIDKLSYAGNAASLLSPPRTLGPGNDTDLRIMGLRRFLDAVRDALRKREGRAPIVQVPLRVEYRDRHHKRWTTEHALTLTARGIEVALVHPGDVREWTNVAKLNRRVMRDIREGLAAARRR